MDIQPNHYRVILQEKNFRVIEIRLFDLPTYLTSRQVETTGFEYFPPVLDYVLKMKPKTEGGDLDVSEIGQG